MKTTFDFRCSGTMPDGVSFDMAGEGTVELTRRELALLLPAQHRMVKLCLDYFSSLLEKYIPAKGCAGHLFNARNRRQ